MSRDRRGSRGGPRRSSPPPRRDGPRTPVDPARLAAFEVLRSVRVDDAYANLVLPQVLRGHGLSGRDAAFATELASGTLRRQGTYDPIIDACLDRPKLEAKVRDVLRIGVHQLLAMRVPTHAAISTSVDLVRARIGTGPTGLVNAVLRRVSEHELDAWVRRVAPSDDLGFAAVAHSHPRWVVGGLRDALAAGGRADELDLLLAADNASPKVCLVARPGLATLEELVAAGAEPTGLSPYAATLSGDPGAVPAVVEGRAGVQDEGSQLVALALTQAPLDGGDTRWLDLCAGPGGKAALLAAIAATRGARVLANERQPHRAELVARGSRAAAAGLLGVVAGDGTAPPWREGTFDRVLVDAPCSGMGALRRRPESRWRRSPRDVADLVGLQRSLLDAALASARPGGLVAYATCSPLLPETAEIVDGVPAELAELVPISLDVPDAEGPLPGTLQLWPHRHGTDAMFVALLRKR